MPEFYSFVVFAPDEIPLEKEHILLERGPNTFNVLLDDVKGFVAKLTDSGVRIIRQHKLDEFEPVSTFADYLANPHDEAQLPQPSIEPGVLVQGRAPNALLFAQSGSPRPLGGSVAIDGDEPEADRRTS
jgi:hypothetical protein